MRLSRLTQLSTDIGAIRDSLHRVRLLFELHVLHQTVNFYGGTGAQKHHERIGELETLLWGD